MAEKGGFIRTTDGIAVPVQMIVDLRGVEARDGNGRKEGGEQLRARLGEFVEDQGTARRLREDREQARAGRRLQHAVARRDRRRR